MYNILFIILGSSLLCNVVLSIVCIRLIKFWKNRNNKDINIVLNTLEVEIRKLRREFTIK